MCGIIRIVVIYTLFFLAAGAVDSHAWFWGAKELVRINDVTYTNEDFKSWWHNYREQGMKIPDTVDPFIDWHLLAVEAESMELSHEPSYRHKVNVFLKVRAIMQLKYDEIDSRLDMSPSPVKKEYERNYVPLWKVRAFYFSDQETAEKKYLLLKGGTLESDAFMELAEEKGGPKHAEERWYRPAVLADYPDWLKTLQGLQTSEYGVPFSMNDMHVVLQLVDLKNGDEEDFNAVKASIEKKLLDKQKGEFNAAFFNRLIEKYEVRVDEDLLKRITLEPSPDFDAKQILVRTTRQEVPVYAFLGIMQKDLHRFKREFVTPEELTDYKMKMLNGMLFQTLSTWEALDRKYEEQSPLKEIFVFYKQHRLIKELEQKIFARRTKVGNEEIRQYYNDHPDRFTPPEMVKLAIWEGEEENADQVIAEMSRGVDFFDVTAKYYAHRVPVQNVPIDHLDPAIRDAVEKLVTGGVSGKFQVNNRYCIVKLVSIKPATVKPFDEVRDEIAKQLEQQSFDRTRAEFLEKLRKKSTITINQKSWESLRSELGA